MCVECGDIARARIERGLERMGALVRSRSPQDIVALQSEILRDNLRQPLPKRLVGLTPSGKSKSGAE
jgi:hypothetical protein